MSVKKHEVWIDHGDKTRPFSIPCAGKDCPLCSSRADDRAKIGAVVR